MPTTPENDQPDAPRGAAPAQPTTPLPGSDWAGSPAGTVPGPPAPPRQDAPDTRGSAGEAAPAYAQPAAPAYAQPDPSGYPAPGQPAAHPFGTPHQPAPGPDRAGDGRGGGHGAFGTPAAEHPSGQPKSRSGALLAGLAIGALLGGVMGGGVAAVVSSNVGPQSSAQGGGTVTLNNPETATEISGVAAVATPSVVTLEVSAQGAAGSGSGVIYREDGYILTNAHVVTLDGAAGDNAVIRVKLSDGRILDGDLVGVDPYADLAVVKVDADDLPAVSVANSDELNVGDLTVAIGAPLNLSNTVTSGVVSALNRGISVGSPLIPQNPSEDEQEQPDDRGDGGFPWDFRFDNPGEEPQQPQQSSGGTVTLPVIQTDASINPGNSGGALLNGAGELIGINVAIASASGSQDTAGSVGLGFAIPSNLAVRVADALIAGERPSHGLLGASVADSSQDTDADADHAGGLIVEVTPGGAADEAGLRAGDVITAVDGVPAVDGTSVSGLIRMHAGGSDVRIDYTRDGKAGETTATLGTLDW